MCLFVILLLILIITGGFTILAISIGGSVAIVLFGDVFVCMWIIYKIMKHILNKRKK